VTCYKNNNNHLQKKKKKKKKSYNNMQYFICSKKDVLVSYSQKCTLTSKHPVMLKFK